MKKFLLALSFTTMSLLAMAQVPQKLNYQGVARNNAGAPIASQAIALRITILDGANAVYNETHNVTTNNSGLFNVAIGTGSNQTGTFANIPWSSGNKFVKVEMDPTGGTNFVSLGNNVELLSVPYALYAANGGTPGPQGPTGPAGATGATGPQGSAGVAGPQGPTGAAGATGATGPANTLTIGTVTSGSAAATITGSAPNQTLNLVLPQGPAGAQGPQGPAGVAGPANALSIGTVTSGGAASATITGTAPSQTLNLVLPAGPAGPQGPAGAAGATGATGAQGPAGSQGPQGLQGIQGPQGPAGPTYTAGSGINITGTIISATDNSTTNELQTLSIAGNALTLSNGGGTVTLPSGGGGGISGSGTANYVTKWTGASAVANSTIQDDGTNIGLGTAPVANNKVSMAVSAGTNGLNVTKSVTTTGSSSAKFSQTAGGQNAVLTNFTGPTYNGLNIGGNAGLLADVSNTASTNAVVGMARGSASNFAAGIFYATHTVGLVAQADDSSNGGYGSMQAYNYSNRRWTPAVYGFAEGQSLDSSRVGVTGQYDGSITYGVGVMGIGFNGTTYANSALDIGVYGSGNDNGVLGDCANPTGNAVFADGNQTATGTKSAVVSTSKGNQLVYCMESPGIWFEDFGNAQLNNGAVTITLDPLFLETVVIDNTHPMVVTVTPQGNCNGLYVVPGTTGFEVRELNGGGSNVTFSYRISAKRKHYQDHRFGREMTQARNIATEYVQPRPIEVDEAAYNAKRAAAKKASAPTKQLAPRPVTPGRRK
jgi:hypothetical protein